MIAQETIYLISPAGEVSEVGSTQEFFAQV